ncbi:Thioredoxin H2 [Camellia lanceoleosa]|uniref:Thioredoxin H2 n=1 Tax=Camellia lanceoleosa TaxID=1840588 RepID=A0ACC0IE68_9ERIC|nr:Thioredoxin H2 [Camellia lanceoleosa]
MGAILSSFLGTGSAAVEESSSSSEPSRVLSFHSSHRWQLHFNSSKQIPKLMVVDFSASWCGPCKFIEPAIHAMNFKSLFESIFHFHCTFCPL